MATQCIHCGSELYAGQRFCRYCGKPSGEFDEESMPTQAMPQQPGTDPQRHSGHTAPQYRPDTAPVYTPPQPSPSYQPPVGPPPVMRPPLYPSVPPTRGRSSWGWIIGLISFGLIGAMVLAVVLITSVVRNNTRGSREIPAAAARSADEKDFGDFGVPGRDISISGRETTIRQSFPLTENSTFKLNIASGEVTVEGWDQPEAEVRVIKRGGSRNDRSRTKIFYTDTAGDLSFRFDQSRARNIEIEVQIKLPRTLRQVSIEGASAELKLTGINGDVEVKSASGEIELADIKGEVSVTSQSGDISLSRIEGNVTTNTASGSAELSQIKGRISSSTTSGETNLQDIIGTARVKSVSGEIKANIIEVIRGESLEFNSTSGEIDLRFNAPLNLDFDASTVSGDIDIPEELGIPVEKAIASRRARGRLGNGGQALTVKTVSGEITVDVEGDQPAASETEAPKAPETQKTESTQSKSKAKGN